MRRRHQDPRRLWRPSRQRGSGSHSLCKCHAIENIAVRCRPCNSQRGNTAYTITEAIDVLARLQAAYRRRPTKTGCEHINAAQRAIQTRADAPSATLHTRDAKAQAALHTALEGAV